VDRRGRTGEFRGYRQEGVEEERQEGLAGKGQEWIEKGVYNCS
jgi:hypothetical protein